VRKRAVDSLGTAFSQIPNKEQAWQDLHKLTQDEDRDVRRGAACSLGTAFSQVPDKDLAWQDLIRLTKDEDRDVRMNAAELFGKAFSGHPDKEQAWKDIHKLTQDKDSDVRMGAARSLGTAFSQIPNKEQAWQDLIRLTKDENDDVRRQAANSLVSAFSLVLDREQAWKDIHKLTQDEERDARWIAANSLGSTFSRVPDKIQAWQDLHKLTQDEDRNVRRGAARSLGTAFSQIPNKEQAWQDLHKLTQDEDRDVRRGAARSLGTAFSQIPNKEQAWQDLYKLIQDEDRDVRWIAASSLGSAFSQVPDKTLAWIALYNLTQDEEGFVQMYAYHSLGKASVYRATESENIDILKRYLKTAVEYFEKSAQGSKFSPARFCHPFYRSYFALTFQGDSQESVQNYLAEAKAAVDGSESRDELLQAVENLAGALQEAQRTKDMQLSGMQCDLNAYMRYCNQAAEYLNQVEKDAPGAAKIIRMGLPNIDQQIKTIIGSIQEKAQTICIQGKGTGTALEAAGLELNHWAKELSFENVLKSERSCSRIEYTLQIFCNRLPVDKRSNICEVVKEIGKEEELPNKLTKIELALSSILNELPIDFDIRKKLDEIHDDIKSLRQSILDRFEISEQKILSSVFERLDRDKLEIISSLLDAIKENRIPKDLTEEALEATKELITEMKSMQIQDPKMAKCVDSWEEAINSPELGIENLIKVTIPIIPFLLTYEGSYKFQTGIKLDSVWNKLRALVRR
jgi:HEAT repeat protein